MLLTMRAQAASDGGHNNEPRVTDAAIAWLGATVVVVQRELVRDKHGCLFDVERRWLCWTSF